MTANSSSSMNATIKPEEDVKDYSTNTSKPVLLWSELLPLLLTSGIYTETSLLRVSIPTSVRAVPMSGAGASSRQCQIFTESFGE